MRIPAKSYNMCNFPLTPIPLFYHWTIVLYIAIMFLYLNSPSPHCWWDCSSSSWPAAVLPPRCSPSCPPSSSCSCSGPAHQLLPPSSSFLWLLHLLAYWGPPPSLSPAPPAGRCWSPSHSYRSSCAGPVSCSRCSSPPNPHRLYPHSSFLRRIYLINDITKRLTLYHTGNLWLGSLPYVITNQLLTCRSPPGFSTILADAGSAPQLSVLAPRGRLLGCSRAPGSSSQPLR